MVNHIQIKVYERVPYGDEYREATKGLGLEVNYHTGIYFVRTRKTDTNRLPKGYEFYDNLLYRISYV